MNSFAANTTGGIITVILGGTNVPVPSNQLLNGGVTVNGANDTFTVPTTGTYLISYQLNLTAGLLVNSRILLNGASYPASVIAPIVAISNFNNTFMASLTAGTTVTLQLFGLVGVATLLTGSAGAALTIVHVSN